MRRTRLIENREVFLAYVLAKCKFSTIEGLHRRFPLVWKQRDQYKYYKHVGIIGYNKKMLDFYKNSIPGRFEIIEGIDTLRFLDYSKKLKICLVSNCHSLSVDTEKDLEVVKNIIARGEHNGKV